MIFSFFFALEIAEVHQSEIVAKEKTTLFQGWSWVAVAEVLAVRVAECVGGNLVGCVDHNPTEVEHQEVFALGCVGLDCRPSVDGEGWGGGGFGGGFGVAHTKNLLPTRKEVKKFFSFL